MNKFEVKPLIPEAVYAWHHAVSLDVDGALVLHWWIDGKQVKLTLSKEETVNLMVYLYDRRADIFD